MKRKQRSDKKQDIVSFRCKKTGQYSNDCEEELPKTTKEKKGTSLFINKEDSSEKELASDHQFEPEEDASMTAEDQHPDKQNTNDTAPDNDKEAEDESYQYSAMFSEDDYDGLHSYKM